MTFYFPDLSVNNAVQIQTGTAMVCAKKTHGSAYLDGKYTSFKSQAANKQSHFFGFHWLNHGSIQAQANLCAKYDVSSVPMMIDAEDQPHNTGYAGTLTVGDITGFASAYRKLGGIVNLVYLPHWYWQKMGSPDLTPLKNAGLHLVSSNYTSYSDSGPGWQSYGGMTPEQWQYTDALSYGGGKVDFNAVKNYTIDEWWSIIGGDMAITDADIAKIVQGIKDMQIAATPPTGMGTKGATAIRFADYVGWTSAAINAILNTDPTQPITVTQDQLNEAVQAGLETALRAIHFQLSGS